jgi:DNA polymerase (family 10)
MRTPGGSSTRAEARDGSRLDARSVAAALAEVGQRLILAGENPYKARSYTRAAESLLLLGEPLESIVAAGRLREIPGVGTALSETIEQLHRHGTTARLEAMRADIPASLLELLSVPGLRPARVLDLHRTLGISSLDELEAACWQDRLTKAKGFGPAFQGKVLAAIELMRRSKGQRLLHHAGDHLAALTEAVRRSHPELTRILPAGEFRRGCELVSELVLAAETPAGSGVQVLDMPEQGSLWGADRNLFGVELVLATGSSGHVRDLQAYARDRGFRLDERGLFRGGCHLICPDEEHVYTALGLPFIPPELREGDGEVGEAAEGRLPNLVADDEIRGLLHCHTDFSDGAHTLEEMAEATRARGFQYFGVADHSRTASYAGGLPIEKVLEQHRLADALNARYGGAFRVIKGIESDILPDGSLDYPDDLLARFDFVVASVHSRFGLDADAQTARIIRAVSNRFTTILGHLTGRLLRRREGYRVDIDRVLRACAENGVAVEINANPHRLDVDWRWHRRALELGCLFSINPDAHSVDELDLTSWGVVMARKGAVPPERVINTLPGSELLRLLAERRAR